MIDTEQTVFLTCEGFTARPHLTQHATQRAARLLRHAQLHPHRVCVHVRCDSSDERAPTFIASATAEKNSLIHVAHGTGRDPQPAITTALHKLEDALLGARKAAVPPAGARRTSPEPITDFLKI